MHGSSTSPPEETPSPSSAEAQATSEPATQADLRTLRRWILVAGVWAVAATAVALIALLDTSGDDAKKTARGLGERTETLEQRQEALGERLDELDTQVEDLAPAADVSKLQDRLERAEKDASAAEKDAKASKDSLADLEDRVAALEDEPPAADDSPGAGDTGSDTP